MGKSCSLCQMRSTPFGRRVDHADIIPNFERSLSRMSGALIERGPKRQAIFVHLSVLEYLTDSSRHHETLDPVSKLVTDKINSQRSCASCCLAYLFYSVPTEPLGGGPQLYADRGLQRSRFSFIEYTAKFWGVHLFEFLAIIPSEPSDEDNLLLKFGSDFLSTKRAVMVWIEACWIFKDPPQIGVKPQRDVLQKLSHEDTKFGSKAELLKRTVRMLGQIIHDLADLNASWAAVLT